MRWYQYTLSHVFICLSIIGTVFGWIGYKIHCAAQERICVERMASHGIRATEDGPIWIREMLNVHFPIVKLELSTDKMTEDVYYETELLTDLLMLKQLDVVEVYGRWSKSRFMKDFEMNANSDDAIVNDQTIIGKLRRVHPGVYIRPRSGTIQ